MSLDNKNTFCNICPNNCNADRIIKFGRCQAPNNLKLAYAGIHMWEEPVISGNKGSGTIFFSNCSLKCVYCQNEKISIDNFGIEVSIDKFIEIMKKLEDKGVHNINLVNPTHYSTKIIEALNIYKPKIPIVYNTSGYEKADIIKNLTDYVDIYLTDFKYADNIAAFKYSHVKDYFERASESLKVMIESKGKPLIDNNNIMQKGVIIRHLVLPSNIKNSLNVLDFLKHNFNDEYYLISVMFQYTPNKRLADFPEINRKLTPLECKIILNHLDKLNFKEGFIQDISSAKKEYTPDFNLQGITD
jgi:putative pyruvate formate lyase activating enzyme